MVLYALSFNLAAGSKKIPSSTATVLESGGALGFAIIGLLAILVGGNYLSNQSAGFGMGIPGQLISGGVIPFIAIAIGIKVASTIVTLFYHLIGGEKLEDGDTG